ncbi:MAG: endolytic transglycosylase MltG [Tissierellia bacterium]|nr:endolytic transglycosylase MltG [Tissierellia bacterium]
MIEAKKNKHKGWKFLLVAILVILAVCVAVALAYYNKSISPVNAENPEEVTFEIPEGSNSLQIASILKDNNLIRSEFVFRLVLKKNDAESSLKAGTYNLNTGMDMDEIIAHLTKGGKNNNVVRFTIPEGYEVKMIAEKLSNEGIVDKDRFLKLASDKKYFEDKFTFLSDLEEGQSLEGYLFPSTYEIFVGASEEEIIEKMLSQFERVFEEKIRDSMDNVELSFNEVVTLASIIEREAKRDDERTLISAVFHNRLKIGMPLQSCATVQYILGERKERLTEADTRIESVYNTYINNGLPPSPIASPGEKSLLAAVNPEDVEYLYFRSKEDGTGAHTFSKTYEEHLKADPNK